TRPITSGAETSRPVIFIHRQWTASSLVQPGANGPAISNFTARRARFHKDTPPSPHVVHIVIHRAVLTARKAGPTFARQQSPGSGPRAASGEGGRTGRSGARGYRRAAPVPGGPGQRTGESASRRQALRVRPCRPDLSVPPVTLCRVRPALKPGLLPVWRD